MGSGASTVSVSSYKLTYFNGRGRAEVPRLCFVYSGTKFNDDRIEQADWPALKPKTPLGFLPVLNVDGKELSQSLVVLRFIAAQCGLMGSNGLERAKIEELIETIADINLECTNTAFIQEDSAKNAAFKKIKETNGPKVFDYLTKTIDENKSKSGYLVGGKASAADLALFNLFESLSSTCGTAAFDKYTKVKDICTKIGENGNIKKYLENRPKTGF